MSSKNKSNKKIKPSGHYAREFRKYKASQTPNIKAESKRNNSMSYLEYAFRDGKGNYSSKPKKKTKS